MVRKRDPLKAIDRAMKANPSMTRNQAFKKVMRQQVANRSQAEKEYARSEKIVTANRAKARNIGKNLKPGTLVTVSGRSAFGGQTFIDKDKNGRNFAVIEPLQRKSGEKGIWVENFSKIDGNWESRGNNDAYFKGSHLYSKFGSKVYSGSPKNGRAVAGGRGG